MGRGARRAEGRRGGGGADRGDDPLLAGVAPAGTDPGPRLARPDPAVRADDQGADVHADRRDRRRADNVVARDPRRRAQLGLPLHLDPRQHLHAPGAALAEPELGGRRVHAVRRRRRTDRGRLAADHVRDRRAARSDRVDPRRALRLRRRPPGADRQRRLRPAPERRLRRRARLDPAPHPSQPAPAAAAVADRADAGRVRDPASGASPTRASGRPAASRSTTSPRSSCAGSRSTAPRKLAEIRGDPELQQKWRATADEIKADILANGLTEQGRPPPALRDGRARRLHAPGRDPRLPARRRRPAPRERERDRRRADRGRLRPPLQDGRDRRRPVGQGGDVPDLLVLARLRARRSSASCSGPAT